jgi:hypothetical protein
MYRFVPAPAKDAAAAPPPAAAPPAAPEAPANATAAHPM